MDTYLAIASKRDERAYAAAPIPPEVERRILDAGRVSGSSRNTQQWEFVVVADAQQELAEAVYAPMNGRTAPETAARICGGEPKAIISFGYPANPRDPQSRSAEEWSARAKRKSLD